MKKFLNTLGLGLIFFSFFLVVFNITMAYEHEVKFFSVLGIASMILGMVLAYLGNTDKQQN
jgi:Ca2+/Na+ antiporter